MSSDSDVTVDVTGNLHPQVHGDFEVERVEQANGEIQLVELTIDTGELEISTAFGIEEAEELLVEVRDSIVEAKREELEWKTATKTETELKPETGQ